MPNFFDSFTFSSEDMWLSEFRLLPGHPSWHRRGQTTDQATLVAFPRASVAIRHDQSAEIVADPLCAVVYRPGQTYRRRLISPEGDDCTILAVSESLMAEVVGHFDTDVDGHGHRLPFTAARVERGDHLAVEGIRRSLSRGATIDSDVIREQLYWALHRLVANGCADVLGSKRQPVAASHVDLARAVLEHLGRDVSSGLSLKSLSDAVAVSPFHLVRTFRSVTGRPIHAYRTELRLRSSLPLIAGGARLADVAQQVGFASHAHLTDRFTRAYGMTPSRWRETTARSSKKSSKNMKARPKDPFIA